MNYFKKIFVKIVSYFKSVIEFWTPVKFKQKNIPYVSESAASIMRSNPRPIYGRQYPMTPDECYKTESEKQLLQKKKDLEDSADEYRRQQDSALLAGLIVASELTDNQGPDITPQKDSQSFDGFGGGDFGGGGSSGSWETDSSSSSISDSSSYDSGSSSDSSSYDSSSFDSGSYSSND